MSDLVQQWDAQQAAYIAGREQRFDAMLDVLGLALPETFTVIDLACGPGSLAARVLSRFPNATVVGVDLDPVLLRLAVDHLAGFGDRVRLVDADLTDPAWVEQVTGQLAGAPDAFVSTTALHWLQPAELVDLYAQAHAALAPRGLLLNGDHLRFDDRLPRVRAWSAAHDESTQAESFVGGASTWDAWWSAVEAVPELAELKAVRDERFATRPAPPSTTVELHLAALRQAGFAECGTVWQLLDDYVVYGAADR